MEQDVSKSFQDRIYDAEDAINALGIEGEVWHDGALSATIRIEMLEELIERAKRDPRWRHTQPGPAASSDDNDDDRPVADSALGDDWRQWA